MNAAQPLLVDLAAENAELRARLKEAEDTLAAIRSGDVDALIVGEEIYTLERAGAASNKLRKDVLAQMDDAVLATDPAGHLIYMNPAAERHYRCDASAALGRPVSALYTELWPEPDDAATAERTLDTRGVCRANSIHRLADGTAFHVESTLCRLRDADGGDAGRLAVIRDVDERVRTAAALREADRRKDEFLATLAHELRNPLAPICNALQIMNLSHERDVHDHARGVIERQVRQMVRLIDDLLDVSRISRGKIELRRTRVDVAVVVRDAIETSRPLIDAAQHALEVSLPEDGALLVDADATRFSQVISNLLNNAAKYTPPGGRIRVGAVALGGNAVIAVRDTGVGIAPDMLPRVFDMFAQVDTSLERAQGGLGIGLALVKRLVNMHGGTVTASSAGRGQGCEFVVRLPLATRDG